ncbi:MAG: protein kinase [Alphaproteobacteria bacterium]|nr:protein kinase [Alphaproteobacteria bacterium]
MAGTRYELLEVLGRGGFGEVWRARMRSNAGFTREVAIKLLLDGADDDAARRLRDEARLLGLIHHRCVVQVLDLQRLDGRWAIVMEYVRGVPLQTWIAAGMRVPLGPALEIVSDVAEALMAAWETPGPDERPLRVLHRDIKPANLQLTAQGELKVLDFGIAHAVFVDREATTSNNVYGTPRYMAPERMLGQDGPAGDVFSLGVVLFELLGGKRFVPLPRVAQGAGLEARLSGMPDLPPEVRVLLLGMLEIDPEARWSARQVLEQCRALRARGLDGPRLRGWATAEVARLERRRYREPGEGLLRPTRSSGPRSPLTMTSSASLRRRRRAFVVALGVGVGLSLTAGAALASTLGWLPSFASVAEETPADVAAIRPLPHPRATSAAEPPVEPVFVPELPQAAPVAQVAPARPPPTRDDAAPTETRLPEVYVKLIGDVKAVVLVGERGRFDVPGPVPPGSYLVEAEFTGWGKRAQDRVQIREGAEATLRCSDRFGLCSGP